MFPISVSIRSSQLFLVIVDHIFHKHLKQISYCQLFLMKVNHIFHKCFQQISFCHLFVVKIGCISHKLFLVKVSCISHQCFEQISHFPPVCREDQLLIAFPGENKPHFLLRVCRANSFPFPVAFPAESS